MMIAQVHGQGPVYVPPARQEVDLRIPRIGAEAIPQAPNFLVRIWNVSIQTANGMFGKISRVFFAVLNWIKPVFGARLLALYTYVCAVWKGVQGQIREEALHQENAQLANRVENLTHEKNNLAAALVLAQEKNVQLEQKAQKALEARDAAVAAKAEQDPQIELLKKTILNLGELHRMAFGQQDQLIIENLRLRDDYARIEGELQKKEEEIRDLEELNEDLERQLPELREQQAKLQGQLADYQVEELLPERYDELNQNILRLIDLSKELNEQGGNNPDVYGAAVEEFLVNVQKRRGEFLQGLEKVKPKLLPKHAEAHALVTMIERVAQAEDQFLRASIETLHARAARQQPLQQLFRQIQWVPQQQVGAI